MYLAKFKKRKDVDVKRISDESPNTSDLTIGKVNVEYVED